MYFLLLIVAIAVVHSGEALRVDCAAVSCLLPTCAEGEISEVPEGECCPICVPDTSECKIRGQVFSNCASPCPRTCESPHPICIALCVKGCKCPTGQVVDTINKRCVRPEKCPPRGESHHSIQCNTVFCCYCFYYYYYYYYYYYHH